jgi:hypothetical protein
MSGMSRRALRRNVYGDSFPGIKYHLVSWLRVIGALTLLSLAAFMPWTGQLHIYTDIYLSLCRSLWMKGSASEGVSKDERGITKRVGSFMRCTIFFVLFFWYQISNRSTVYSMS